MLEVQMMENNPTNNIKLFIQEEKLDVKKKWIKTGEINFHKEVLTEEKNFTIPVMREELVIEKKYIDTESPHQVMSTETTRIPIREERIEINKHIIELEEVEIYKQQLEQTETVKTMLKKEVLFSKTTAIPNK